MNAEAIFVEFAEAVALATEAAVVLVLAVAVLRALGEIAVHAFAKAGAATAWQAANRAIGRRLAVSIVLALELALAADIVRTAIAPDWDSIGKLAAIATIRTALNWFLMRDLEETRASAGPGAATRAGEG